MADDSPLPSDPIGSKLEALTKWLADPMVWNWTRASGDRDVADAVLKKMAELHLIQHREHKYGGSIWTVNGVSYGRTKD